MRLEKAAMREIIIHEWTAGVKLDKAVRWKTTQHFVKFAVSHQSVPLLPVGVPAVLASQLRALMTSWKRRFSSSVPLCPAESFIYNKSPLSTNADIRRNSSVYLRGICQWMFAMQEHRAACVQHLQQRKKASLFCAIWAKPKLRSSLPHTRKPRVNSSEHARSPSRPSPAKGFAFCAFRRKAVVLQCPTHGCKQGQWARQVMRGCGAPSDKRLLQHLSLSMKVRSRMSV